MTFAGHKSATSVRLGSGPGVAARAGEMADARLGRWAMAGSQPPGGRGSVRPIPAGGA